MITLNYCYESSCNRPGWGIIDLQADTPVFAWDRHDQNERETPGGYMAFVEYTR